MLPIAVALVLDFIALEKAAAEPIADIQAVQFEARFSTIPRDDFSQASA